jgi:hypothetical protein
MPKFTKTEDELKTDFDKWLFVLKNLPRLQARPRALQERIFQRLFQIAAIEQLSSKDRRRYDESLKNYWDMQNVIDTAVEKAVVKAVMEKENVIIEQEKELSEKENVIIEKENVIIEQAKELSEKENVIIEQAKTLAEQKKEIEALQRRLNQLP